MDKKSNGCFVLLIGVPSKRLVESELISVDVDLFHCQCGVMIAQRRHTGDLSALDRAIHTSSYPNVQAVKWKTVSGGYLETFFKSSLMPSALVGNSIGDVLLVSR